MKPLHERITEAVNAIAEAASHGKQASLVALSTHLTALLAEVKTLEEKTSAPPTQE